MSLPYSFFNTPQTYKRKLECRITGKITLKPTKKTKKYALLSYVTHPFTITKSELMRAPHTNPWECLIIAEILLDRGYIVDVIDWTNYHFVPKKQYSIVIDVNQNLERLTPFLPESCIKIFYITGAHWSYQNKAEQKRLEELKNRRGCILKPRRKMNPSNNIENAKYATALGNGFARKTYSYSGKNIIDIPLFSTAVFPSPENKNFQESRKNFVWIGGGGAVHKGLDLTLEAFSQMPDYQLTICGPIATENDFVTCYHKELYSKPNIKLVGRIDVQGEQFKKIINEAVGLVYPSCSEGQAGSVIVGMHAGLIPIVTYESGIDAEPFGIKLETASVEEIMNSVRTISELQKIELKKRAVATWTYAQEHHTKEKFKSIYASFIDNIIKENKI